MNTKISNEESELANRMIAKNVIEERLAIAANQHNITTLAHCIDALEATQGGVGMKIPTTSTHCFTLAPGGCCYPISHCAIFIFTTNTKRDQ